MIFSPAFPYKESPFPFDLKNDLFPFYGMDQANSSNPNICKNPLLSLSAADLSILITSCSKVTAINDDDGNDDDSADDDCSNNSKSAMCWQ